MCIPGQDSDVLFDSVSHFGLDIAEQIQSQFMA